MPEAISCDLCGASPHSQKLLFRSRDFGKGSLPSRLPIVQCRRCGLIFVNPRPTSDELGAYYEDHVAFCISKRGTIPSKEEFLKHEWRYTAITRHQPYGRRILDVGSGDGTFLKLMQLRGWETSGVEIATGPAEYSRSVLGLEVFRGNLEAAHFPDNSFDVVTFYQSLEHLPHPLQTLKEVFRILVPKGLLIINVPNITTPAFWLFGKHYYYLQVPFHLFFFYPAILQKAIESVGFRSASITFSNSFDALARSGLLLLQEWGYRLGMARNRGKILLVDKELGRMVSAVLRIQDGVMSWRSQLFTIAKQMALLGLRICGRVQQKLHIGEVFSLYAIKPSRAGEGYTEKSNPVGRARAMKEASSAQSC